MATKDQTINQENQLVAVQRNNDGNRGWIQRAAPIVLYTAGCMGVGALIGKRSNNNENNNHPGNGNRGSITSARTLLCTAISMGVGYAMNTVITKRTSQPPPPKWDLLPYAFAKWIEQGAKVNVTIIRP